MYNYLLMGLWHYLKTVKEHTIQNRLNIIIGLVILVLLFGLLNFWFGMRVMSGIRAYVGGEGLWSKAQKAAVINLIEYTHSHNDADYEKFLKNIKVQLGDKQAREEMNKPDPDIAVVREGFVQGGNHPDDVGDLYFLYRRFGDTGHVKSAVTAWEEGDREISNLLGVGDRIHKIITTPLPSGATRDQVRQIREAQLSSALNEVYAIDTRLTVLENRFSAALGEGSRQVTKTLLTATIAITALLGLLSLTVAIMISRTLVRLDKQKSEFVSLASHQLRTPLTAMNWNTELLLAEPTGTFSPAQKKYAQRLKESGQRMSALIGDLLRVSSLDLGTYRPEEKEIKINDTIDTIIRDHEEEIAQKNISLVKNVSPDIPIIKIDEQLINVIFQNLVSNSIKYSRQGGRIEINVEIKKRNLMIRVSDNGIGIPSKQQPQIFTKLFRADNAVKHNFNEGTGLGLYIAKAMTLRMGGRIWFDSTENVGTNFYVKLPLRALRGSFK
jgi:signal transduction histidine kinase